MNDDDEQRRFQIQRVETLFWLAGAPLFIDAGKSSCLDLGKVANRLP